jgi:hypothetical protein
MPIGKDITRFAETLSARHESNVQLSGSSNWLRQRSAEDSARRLNEMTSQLGEYLHFGNNVPAKTLALDIANEARNIWEKL